MNLLKPIDYRPAELVDGEYRWYVKYYQTNPSTGKMERFRETYNLNRIKRLKERRKKAAVIIEDINRKLPLGWPYEEEWRAMPKEVCIIDAITAVQKLKCTTDRKRTRDTIISTYRIFADFLRRNNWQYYSVNEFRKEHAIAFLDDAVLRGVQGRTYNNYIERMRSLFQSLKDRNFIDENPFLGIRKKKARGKRRRAFNDTEKRIVIDAVAREDKWLLLGILLQYHCFIRPIELRRLRFYMLDLVEGIIRLSPEETKNREADIVTIPDVLMPFLRAFHLEQWNQRWLIFGERVNPHPTKCCGHNTMNWRHGNILKALHKKGALADIKGLSFYSWKDTGAMDLFRNKVNPLEIMRQLRHKNLATTQLYCQSLYQVNEEIKALDNSLIRQIPEILNY